jgi:hypothetical protein
MSQPELPGAAAGGELVVAKTVLLEEIETDGEVVVDEIVDIEVYVRERRRVPHARGYLIRVDKVQHTVHQPVIEARKILELAGKTPPEKYILRQIVHGQPVKLELDELVDLRAPGVEKFKTMPKTARDGGH